MPKKPNPFLLDDDNPEWTAADFKRAKPVPGALVTAMAAIRKKAGRPRSAAPKQHVSLRLDAAVLAGLRATGPGWQTKANAVLKAWLAKQQKRQRPRRMRRRGRNLWLQVSGAHGKSWVFRYARDGKTRYMGLGSAADVSLAAAQAAAQELRQDLRAGVDPIEARKARKARRQGTPVTDQMAPDDVGNVGRS